MIHPLQNEWLTAAGEYEYVKNITALLHAGALFDAQTKLLSDLLPIASPLADLCRALRADSIEISGWEDMSAVIAHYEGDPITAVHILMSNEPDLVFGAKNDVYDPVLDIAFYTDATLAFSTLTPAQVLTESLRSDAPWYGQSEDIESYIEITGMGELNTALLRHKNQYFLRPGADEDPVDEVPLAYIEFTLAALIRVLRFHQAVKAELDRYGLPSTIPVMVGMDNMRHSLGSVYLPSVMQKAIAREPAALSIKIKPRETEAVISSMGGNVRRHLAITPDEEPTPPRLGFFRRLLGLAQRRKSSASAF